MEKTKYILGIDGGGTKTDLALANEEGVVIATVQCGQSNLHNEAAADIVSDLKGAVKRLFREAKVPASTKISAIGVGVAGLDSDHDQRVAKRVFGEAFFGTLAPKGKLQIVNDTVIGFLSGSDAGYGICVIGGTGSNCYGRSKSGKEGWASGLGHILADEGGGYDLGLKALHAAVKSADGRGRKTVLEKMVLDFYKVKSVRDLVPICYYKPYTKVDIAKLALLVEDAAVKGDPVAKRLAMDAADELVLMVKAVGRQITLSRMAAFDLVMIGGVIQYDPVVNHHFKKEVRKLYPRVVLIVPTDLPVMGAVRLALSSLR